MPEELDLTPEENDDLDDVWDEIAQEQQDAAIREFERVFSGDVIVSRRDGAFVGLAIDGWLEMKTYDIDRATKILKPFATDFGATPQGRDAVADALSKGGAVVGDAEHGRNTGQND